MHTFVLENIVISDNLLILLLFLYRLINFPFDYQILILNIQITIRFLYLVSSTMADEGK